MLKEGKCEEVQKVWGAYDDGENWGLSNFTKMNIKQGSIIVMKLDFNKKEFTIS